MLLDRRQAQVHVPRARLAGEGGRRPARLLHTRALDAQHPPPDRVVIDGQLQGADRHVAQAVSSSYAKTRDMPPSETIGYHSSNNDELCRRGAVYWSSSGSEDLSRFELKRKSKMFDFINGYIDYRPNVVAQIHICSVEMKVTTVHASQ